MKISHRNSEREKASDAFIELPKLHKLKTRNQKK